MSASGIQQLSLPSRSASLAKRGLFSCNYRSDLVRDDYPLPGERQGIVAFAHRPFDTRSSCIVILPSGSNPEGDVLACRETGASLFFIAGESNWNVWKQTSMQPKHLRSLRPAEVEGFFRQHRDEFAPGTIFRAKSWQRAGVGRQLDFVDAGLLPMLEREAGGRLLDLFERMVAVTMNSLGWDTVPEDEADAHWLTQTNFWLLAAKLLHDKRVERFINLDFQDVSTVFGRVAFHYNRRNPVSPKLNGKLRALQHAAREAGSTPSYHNISAETLGMLYEEALISPTTRKLLGTHRTPTYLVDYMLAKLSGWIDELGHERCHVFEPACGHAPFMSGALRLVSDMLPPKIADDPKRRHDYLRDRLRGCDHDPFALEIARLSLTLADIPNENGWVLEPQNMFAEGVLAKETRAATVVLANPPFEKEQAATFLQRTVPALQPGAVFGFVLPVNELTGAACAAVRRQLLEECEIREISVFPDRMFKFASWETGIVLGRKHEARRAFVPSGIQFRRVREPKIDDFRERYTASWQEEVMPQWLRSVNNSSFVVPELRRIWESCAAFQTLSSVASVTKGFDFRSLEDPLYPKGQITDSPVAKPEFVPGFKDLAGDPQNHSDPQLVWLNSNPRIINAKRGGTAEKIPQVLQSYSPTDRDPWRHKVFIDRVGRRATSRFLIIRPRAKAISLECLWALCCSPVANAYTFARTTKRDITIGVLRSLPVPSLGDQNLANLESAVRAYIAAAVDITKRFQKPPTTTKARIKAAIRSTLSTTDQMQLGFLEGRDDGEVQAAQNQLRALHWRVDAEVLRLYALPPKVERELLDAFDDVRRVGVPFEQLRYIPLEFRDVLTLDEFLRITDEWDATEARRCQLIEKRIKTGRRTTGEEAEFRQLQRLLTLRRRFSNSQPMVDTKKIGELLREEQEWERTV